MKKFWDIFRLAGNHKPQLWGSLIFNLLNAVFSVFTFAALVPILQVIFKTKGENVQPPAPDATFFQYWYEKMSYELDQYVQAEGPLNALILVCIVTVVLAFFKNFFNMIAQYCCSFYAFWQGNFYAVFPRWPVVNEEM